MSLDEFTAWENEQDQRHEFVDGEITLMTGGSQAHALIAANLISLATSAAWNTLSSRRIGLARLDPGIGKLTLSRRDNRLWGVSQQFSHGLGANGRLRNPIKNHGSFRHDGQGLGLCERRQRQTIFLSVSGPCARACLVT